MLERAALTLQRPPGSNAHVKNKHWLCRTDVVNLGSEVIFEGVTLQKNEMEIHWKHRTCISSVVSPVVGILQRIFSVKMINLVPH